MGANGCGVQGPEQSLGSLVAVVYSWFGNSRAPFDPAKTSAQTVCEPDVLRLTAQSGFSSSSFGKAAVHIEVPLFEGT